MVPGSPSNKGINFLEGVTLVFSNQGGMSRIVPAEDVSKATSKMPWRERSIATCAGEGEPQRALHLREQIFRELPGYVMGDFPIIFLAFELTLVAKNLECAADHPTNIAESTWLPEAISVIPPSTPIRRNRSCLRRKFV
jgi:hypothetical protein